MMSLYLNVLPLSLSGEFLCQFFKQGWNWFYKFTLVIFNEQSELLLRAKDEMEVIRVLKDVYNCNFESQKGGKGKQLDWALMMLRAIEIQL